MANLLWLSQEDVLSTGIQNMSIAQPEVEKTLRLSMSGETKLAQEIPLKLQLEDSDQGFYSLPAYIGGPYAVAGLKWTTYHPQNKQNGLPYVSTLLTLSDADNGLPLAVMEGSVISAMRTGAVSATALKYLADPEATSLLCCGAGIQARQQIKGAYYALPHLEIIRIWGRTRARAEQLAEELRPLMHGVKIEVVSDPSSAARISDIVIGATSTPTPYLYKDDFKDGSLYCHIGFNDIDADAIAAFDEVVCDDYEAGLAHSGQSIFRMSREGKFESTKLFGLLGEMITGQKQTRQHQGKKLMFNAFGLVLFDIALGHYVYNYAKMHGIGKELSLWNDPIWK